jgi:hypothetical protein
MPGILMIEGPAVKRLPGKSIIFNRLPEIGQKG